MKTTPLSCLTLSLAVAQVLISNQLANGQMTFQTQARSTTLLGSVVSSPGFGMFQDTRDWFGATRGSSAQVGQFSTLSSSTIEIELTSATGNRGSASSRFVVDFAAQAGTTYSFGGNRRTRNNGVGSVIATVAYRLERIDIVSTVLLASSPSPTGPSIVNQPFSITGTLPATGVYRLTAEVISLETGAEAYLTGTFTAVPTPTATISLALGGWVTLRRRRIA